MKGFYVLLIMCFFQNIFFAQKDSLRDNNLEIYRNTNDERCKADILKARQDAKNANIYFLVLPAPQLEEFLPENELKNLLAANDIKWGGFQFGSDISAYYPKDCYASEHNKLTEEKFGEKKLENLVAKSYELFAKNNFRRVFEMSEVDAKPKTNIENEKNIENLFWANLEEPTGYTTRKPPEHLSYVEVVFLIDQRGKVTDLKINSKFQNPKNKKYTKFFQKKLKKLVNGTRWEPNRYKGFAVKSRANFRINLILL
ncbi:MAG: hypothetical protein K0M63_01365 [Weeksellaceae bacterium]|nr:hypothetical protein [Weeksellaceae bacterium]